MASKRDIALVVEGFLDRLLPGLHNELRIGGERVHDGSLTWCNHILARAVLRGTNDGEAKAARLNPADTGLLAALAEQQALQGNPVLLALYQRLGARIDGVATGTALATTS